MNDHTQRQHTSHPYYTSSALDNRQRRYGYGHYGHGTVCTT